jgi:hypothetical protein
VILETVLPHKLSDLAQIALDDVLKVHERDGYIVNMQAWLERHSAACVVCAAGAVAVERLNPARDMDVTGTGSVLITRFGLHNGTALLAVDMLRRGWVGAALSVIESETPASTWEGFAWDRVEPSHHPLNRLISAGLAENDIEPDDDDNLPADQLLDSEEWGETMRRLIADLREAGL